ncbi:hypothetical protein AMTRI_Chr05g71500 [Amborella trichopoda]
MGRGTPLSLFLSLSLTLHKSLCCVHSVSPFLWVRSMSLSIFRIFFGWVLF